MDTYVSIPLEQIQSTSDEAVYTGLEDGIRALGFGTVTIAIGFMASTVSVHPNFIPVIRWKSRILLRSKLSKPFGESPDDFFTPPDKYDDEYDENDDDVPF